MTGFWQDLRLALRTVWKQPGFTLTAAITLAKALVPDAAHFAAPTADFCVFAVETPGMFWACNAH